MPRAARKKSESNIYHVMLRGINQQQIFEDQEDHEKFLQVLSDCKEISGFRLFAYCLMGNHAHLLLQVQNEPLDQVFKRIGSRFVYWYNIKYQRIGHLFQDRYKSEPVDDDVYFLTVLRYIHANPVKAGLCSKADQYMFSSYREYIGTSVIIDTEFVRDMMSLESFIAFHTEENNDLCLDIIEHNTCRITDEEAQRIMMKYTKCKSAAEFQKLETSMRDKLLRKLRSKGLSLRQISRLTGISFGVVRKFS